MKLVIHQVPEQRTYHITLFNSKDFLMHYHKVIATISWLTLLMYFSIFLYSTDTVYIYFSLVDTTQVNSAFHTC